MPENKITRRLPAEWTPQSAVQLTFPHAGTDWAEVLDTVLPCFIQIAVTISRFEPVLIVCPQAEELRRRFPARLPENIRFFETPSNDTWARDHGAITVFDNDQPVLLDFMFNGWGLKFPADRDNRITRNLWEAGLLRGRHRYPGMVLEGGAIESDGQGTLLTTAECLLSPNRNPHLSKIQIEKRLKSLFGLEQVLWLHHGYLAGDDTDSHIDTLARLCSPDTIAYVRCDDPDDEHYAALQAMERELHTFRTLAGKAYRLVPLPWPDGVWRFGGLEVWRFGGLEVWRVGGLEVWRFGGLEVWRFGGLEVWRFGGLEVWRLRQTLNLQTLNLQTLNLQTLNLQTFKPPNPSAETIYNSGNGTTNR
jgi:agmatine deiminase